MTDIFFCIPIIFGCPVKVKQEGTDPHVCPRCHNPQVVKAKSRRWFEFFWIPLIPMQSKHLWMCGICQWQSPIDGQFQPQPAHGGGFHHGGGGYGGGGGYPPPPKHH